eukprot:TRINITY_DN19540_c0_g1_i1.p1 TRINITY_DN19540_c0_g1~~TRINITY_DN19540_c0_g1_i1.p1  ORF type:complete len:564 (-),score=125.01 TRINITY_DN19540_c0_g1_i1:23-1714(-)
MAVLPTAVSGAAFAVSLSVWVIFVFGYGVVLSFGLLRFWLNRREDAISKRRPNVVALYVIFLSLTGVLKYTFQLLNLKIIGRDGDDFVSRINCYVSFLIPSDFGILTNLMLMIRQCLLVFDFRVADASVLFAESKIVLKSPVTAPKEPSSSAISTTVDEKEDGNHVMSNEFLGDTLKKIRSNPEMFFKSNCLLNLQHYFKKRNLSIFLLVVVILVEFGFTIIAWRDEHLFMITQNMTQRCSEFRRYFEVLDLAFLGLDAVMMMITLILLKNNHEIFGIKKELSRVCAMLSFLIVIRTVNVLTTFDFEQNLNQTLFGGFLAFPFLEFCFPTAYILYQSLFYTIRQINDPSGLKTSKKSDGFQLPPHVASSSPQEQFEWLLKNPRGFNLFREYLANELSVENLLFWQDVENFHRGKITGLAVYETYIKDFAPFLVNLPHPVRQRIARHFEDAKMKRYHMSLAVNNQSEEFLQRPLMEKELKIVHDPNSTGEAIRKFNSNRQSLEEFSSISRSTESAFPSECVDTETSRMIFDDAQKRIFLLMLRDPFSRFQKAHGLSTNLNSNQT